MGKRRPTYDLQAVELVLGSIESLAITTTALRSATSLGFDRPGVVEIISGIQRGLVEPSGPTIQLTVLLDRHPDLIRELR